ncbi:MAG: response regulator [ANME-2 cluster archaeon]|nr:MAG: response regulator [ANME-2 cluster archaeon]
MELFNKNKHDLVLTDLVMPALGGLEVLKEVMRINPKTHVVIITAFARMKLKL